MATADRWYRNAIIYGVDVKTFMDSNGDGTGDLPGLISRLDYIRGLGASAIWLLPCHPSPWRDNGYDVTDYYAIDPRLGTLGDFVELVRRASERGIQILLDLVVHHTSDEHPWFQEARRDPTSRYRNFYIWTESPPPVPEGRGNIFPGEESGVWAFDEEAGAYYHHRFYDFQPTLDHTNPEVRREVERILGFWLQIGVAGFRVDAASHLIEPKGGLERTRPDDPHAILRGYREFVTLRRGDAVLLGEADESPEEMASFFGDGDELNLLFNFLIDNHLFLALAREDAEPLITGLKILPSIPVQAQWANFLRNMDELDLERLTTAQRNEVYEAFAPEEGMRIYDRGIRRRLAPMLGGERQRIELAFSLLLSLPGSAVLMYGDEIGMGDDLSLEGRDAVRTPMQWSNAPNGGFSTAPAASLVRPSIAEGEYGYPRVNVQDQERDPDSLLGWMERMIRLRRETPEIGQGAWSLVETGEHAVIAMHYELDGSRVVVAHNLGREACTVALPLSGDGVELVELLGHGSCLPVEDGECAIEIDGRGYRWFRVRPAPGGGTAAAAEPADASTE